MPSPTGAPPLRVLLVETDEADAARIRDLLAQTPFRVEADWARSFDAGFSRMTSNRYDAHLVSGRLGERSGIDLLRAYHEAGGQAPVLLLGGARDRALDLAAMESEP
jgi:DNA-binding response OmpR family regulator